MLYGGTVQLSGRLKKTDTAEGIAGETLHPRAATHENDQLDHAGHGGHGQRRHLLGYARVSTTDQQPQLQVDALEQASCCRVFTETASCARAEPGPSSSRPWTSSDPATPSSSGGSTASAAPSSTSSRRSPSWATAAIGFRSLQEAIDTTTPGGKLVFHVFGALAEFERDLIRERTAPGWPRPGPGVARAAGHRS